MVDFAFLFLLPFCLCGLFLYFICTLPPGYRTFVIFYLLSFVISFESFHSAAGLLLQHGGHFTRVRQQCPDMLMPSMSVLPGNVWLLLFSNLTYGIVTSLTVAYWHHRGELHLTHYMQRCWSRDCARILPLRDNFLDVVLLAL